ncbi:hypothetical protein [Sphingomonas profundi]|uniref:hypothetical protein n=1 Tax=Alterirhizorhabdus profundi TaxID=2681549 RepID=UPI001E47CF52|nr:hypothetical protein [Sphingomonas profundi]
MNRIGFRRRTTHVLTEAQNALNVSFGAILSAYIGNSLAEIDNRQFDHHALAQFFLSLTLFIIGLCLGNALMMRGEYRFAGVMLTVGAIGAVLAHGLGRTLGFEVVVLRILCGCWVTALVGSHLILTLFLYIHHRTTT